MQRLEIIHLRVFVSLHFGEVSAPLWMRVNVLRLHGPDSVAQGEPDSYFMPHLVWGEMHASHMHFCGTCKIWLTSQPKNSIHEICMQ